MYSVVFFIVVCDFSRFVNSCLFAICVHVYRPLSQGVNPRAVNKYHIIILNLKATYFAHSVLMVTFDSHCTNSCYSLYRI